MMGYLQTILTAQFEAALCMLNQCLRKCPCEHWDGKIGNAAFGQVAYHTLFFVDYYLSTSEEAFELSDLHRRGGDERLDAVSIGLNKEETLGYLAICGQKLVDTLATESQKTLVGPAGFTKFKFSRGELHLYNLRHVQHHTGQLSAYLRRIVDDGQGLGWIKSGWR